MEISYDQAGARLRDLEEQGLSQRETIREILAGCHIDLSMVASRSVLSLDVGEGPEITAFAPFHPNPFVATERDEHGTSWGDTDGALDIIKKQYPSVRILRDSVIACLEKLSHEHRTFGLITYLYIFPEDGRRYERLKQTFTRIGALLKPGGVMVAGLEWVDEEESYGNDFFRAGYHVFRELDYFVDSPIIQGGSLAGGLFLVSQKPA